MKRLRYQAAEYLRQGIEDVRAAAAYVFRNDPASLERYPSLFVRKRRKTDKVKAADEVSPSVPEIASDAPQTSAEPSAVNPARGSDNIGAIPVLG